MVKALDRNVSERSISKNVSLHRIRPSGADVNFYAVQQFKVLQLAKNSIVGTNPRFHTEVPAYWALLRSGKIGS
jgi:hypothetical protein